MTNFIGRWLVSDTESKNMLHISFFWGVKLLVLPSMPIYNSLYIVIGENQIKCTKIHPFKVILSTVQSTYHYGTLTRFAVCVRQEK